MDIELDDGIPTLGQDRKGIIRIDKLEDLQFWNKRTVITHTRKANDKKYPSPMIVLDSNYKDLIGRTYTAFKGTATYRTMVNGKETRKLEGDCIVLFFCNEWKGKQVTKRGI